MCTIVQSHGATGISDLTTVCTTTCPVPRTGGRISSIPRYLALDPVTRHDHQSERFCEAIGANARFGYKLGCLQNFDDSMSNMRTSGGISVNGHGKNHRRKVWRPHRCVLLSTLHLHHYSAARIFRLGSVYSAYTGAMEEIQPRRILVVVVSASFIRTTYTKGKPKEQPEAAPIGHEDP